jgi:hypothetical protein
MSQTRLQSIPIKDFTFKSLQKLKIATETIFTPRIAKANLQMPRRLPSQRSLCQLSKTKKNISIIHPIFLAPTKERTEIKTEEIKQQKSSKIKRKSYNKGNEVLISPKAYHLMPVKVRDRERPKTSMISYAKTSREEHCYQNEVTKSLVKKKTEIISIFINCPKPEQENLA